MFGRIRDIPKPALARRAFAVFLLLVLIFSLYLWHLGTLTQGLSPAEVSARTASSSFQAIADNPLYTPHKILQYAFHFFLGHGAIHLRVVSVIYGMAFLFCFYQLVRRWFGKLIGFFATLFLLATPWFILLARQGTPDILLLAPLAVLACYYQLAKSKTYSALLALSTVTALSMYVPAGPWLILIGLFICHKELRQNISAIRTIYKVLAIFLVLILMVPLILGVVKNPSLIKPLLLIPADWPSPMTAIKSIVWSALAIVWRMPVHIDFIIGRLPIFNYAQTILALFGAFALFKLARSKLYLLLYLLMFAILAAGIHRNPVLLSLGLPAIAILVAAGLRYLYMEWGNVFPKNPIPKYLALILISSLVGLHVLYGLHYSLIAWPNTAPTRSTYMLK